MSNTAIILAAGNGTRMNIKKSKMLLEINGKSVIQRTAEAFLSIDEIDEIIIACRESDIKFFSELLPSEKITFVIGGATRQQSVQNAVNTIDNNENSYIIIHDGARCLVTADVIKNTLELAKATGAAATGVFVKDTIKVVDKSNKIISTPDRSSLVAVQTPQIFKASLYKAASQKALEDKMDFTDDCRIAEYAGYSVSVFPGDYSNIKITTPDDIPLAESILLSRGEK